MSEKLDYVTGQQKFKYISDQVESRKRDAANTESKIKAKLNMRKNLNYIHVDDDVLASIITIHDNKKLSIIRAISPRKNPRLRMIKCHR